MITFEYELGYHTTPVARESKKKTRKPSTIFERGYTQTICPSHRRLSLFSTYKRLNSKNKTCLAGGSLLVSVRVAFYLVALLDQKLSEHAEGIRRPRIKEVSPVLDLKIISTLAHSLVLCHILHALEQVWNDLLVHVHACRSTTGAHLGRGGSGKVCNWGRAHAVGFGHCGIWFRRCVCESWDRGSEDTGGCSRRLCKGGQDQEEFLK